MSVDSYLRRKTIPRLTGEIYSIPLDHGRYIIYAPLRRAAFVANRRAVNFLADLMAGIYRESSGADESFVEFLRRLNIVDADPEIKPITSYKGYPKPIVVTLFLTTACNLRCTYCYASAGDTPTKFMSLQTAKDGIDYVIKNALDVKSPKVEVAYHGGGEPTVNWKVMTESLAYAKHRTKDLGLGLYSGAASNGVLSDQQIDWVISNLNGVSLSFDGLPSINDLHRPTVSGKGSSEQVMHTIRRFDEEKFPYGLRVTVTSDQIMLLPESIEFICQNFRVNKILVEPVYQLGRGRSAPSAETSQFIEAYRDAQSHAAVYGREISYSGARVDTLTNHFCGVSQDSFALSPDGNVSACYEVFSEDNPLAKTFFYGQPDKEKGGYRLSLPVLNNLRMQSVEQRQYCQGCFAKWHCAGDCLHKALTVSDSGEFEGSDRCHITRELTKDQILAKIMASGGVFWYEPLGQESPAEEMYLLSHFAH